MLRRRFDNISMSSGGPNLPSPRLYRVMEIAKGFTKETIPRKLVGMGLKTDEDTPQTP